MGHFLLLFLILSSNAFGVGSKISEGTHETKETDNNFQNLPSDCLCEILDYQSDASKCKIRTLNKLLWNSLRPWSDEMNKKGLLVKKPEVGFVYLPDEMQRSIHDLGWLWKQETLDAVTNETEPEYLKILSDLYSQEFEKFSIQVNLSDDASRQDRIKHGTFLFLISSVVNRVSWNVACHAARDAVSDAVSDAASDAASDTASDTASDAAWDTASDAAWDAAWDAASDAACHAAWGATWDATWGAANDAAWDAACDAARSRIFPEYIGKMSYRVAEKTSLFFLIKNVNSKGDNEKSIFEKIHNAVKTCEIENIENSPFASRVSWERFRDRHFSELTPDQKHFVQPMLDQLEKIVDKIESLPAE